MLITPPKNAAAAPENTKTKKMPADAPPPPDYS